MARSTAKKAAVKKPAWRLSAIGLGILLTLGSAGWFVVDWLTEPGRFPLRVVEVRGEFRFLAPEDIEQTVGRAIDGGFFDCDMRSLRASVLKMPWVDDLSIRRRWPDTLSMQVVEQVPLARWGEHSLISASGVVFRPANLDEFAGLVRLAGPEGGERRVIDFFLEVREAASGRDLEILSVEQDQRRHWWLRFADDLTVSLGHERIRYRLAQFLRVYPSLKARADRRPARIDMRYAHGFAVRWRDIPVGDTGINDGASKVQA